ncbi:putative ATP-dependent RNA helicase [Candidatus Methanoplasma termitum]|uniref:Putative ATP-dependent RNA helicase n=1 Tax=Candidatus Methanoplasma termitum TaxID=1577791 RepID=A0A0A7LFD4_9ARCH|nr:DEAD/DEAH box helicase [Candidatus Methanoplasma termitum]AIZ56201.1 putative ATP-dependent RNA helicase [Candidatus Methanoplasma termitum]
MEKFEDLGINKHVVKAMREIGWIEPTPIQTEAIPAGIEGKDILAQAQTGTGKTGAYASVVLTRTAAKSRRPSALILAPTRELACQIENEMYKLSKYSGHSSTVVYGGASIEAQIKDIRKGRDIVVGTPGRLKDLITRDVLDLSQVSVVVIDEADRMLDMGFADELNFIMDEVPKQRQTLLLSATMAEEVKHLALKYMKDRVDISVSKDEICSDLTEQYYIQMPRDKKEHALKAILRKGCKAIVFCQTKRMVDVLYNDLSDDFRVGIIHGDIEQNKRERAIKKFRDDQTAILIATDVAARGIDVNNIDCVINYDIPNDAETYLHRIGRTGRAGNKGIAITFVTKPEKRFIKICEREMGKTISPMVPDDLVLSEREETKPIERTVVERAAAAPVAVPQTDAGSQNKMVPLQINLGKEDKFSRSQLSMFIKKNASLDDDSLGRVGLGQSSSYVEVSHGSVNTVLNAMTGAEWRGKKISMNVAPKKLRYKDKEAAGLYITG